MLTALNVCMRSVVVIRLHILKGKDTALNTMVSGNYQCLASIGDVGTTHTESVNAAMPFFVALYSQPQERSMESTRYPLLAQ